MSAIWRTLYRATFNINTRLKRSLAPVAKPRAQAMCLVNFQPDEEIGSSRAAEDSCAAEILIFDWTIFASLRRVVRTFKSGSRVPEGLLYRRL